MRAREQIWTELCLQQQRLLELGGSTERWVLSQHHHISRRLNACGIEHTSVSSTTPARCPTPHPSAQPTLTVCRFTLALTARLPGKDGGRGSTGGRHGWTGGCGSPPALQESCLRKPKLPSTQIQGLFRVVAGGWGRVWVVPGVPARTRTGSSKATSGHKQVPRDRKQPPALNATDFSTWKSYSCVDIWGYQGALFAVSYRARSKWHHLSLVGCHVTHLDAGCWRCLRYALSGRRFASRDHDSTAGDENTQKRVHDWQLLFCNICQTLVCDVAQLAIAWCKCNSTYFNIQYNCLGEVNSAPRCETRYVTTKSWKVLWSTYNSAVSWKGFSQGRMRWAEISRSEL